MQTTDAHKDAWSDGKRYELYVGRWSRLVAREFVTWLGVAERSAWVDLGCGTGALTGAILENAQPRGVVAVDASDGYIAHARRDITDQRATFHVADALSIPMASEQADVAVAGLVLNFVTAPAGASPR